MAPLKPPTVVKLLFYKEFLDKTQNINLLIGIDEGTKSKDTATNDGFSCYFLQIKVDNALLTHIKDPNFTKVSQVQQRFKNFVKSRNMMALVAEEVNQKLGIQLKDEQQAEEVSVINLTSHTGA